MAGPCSAETEEQVRPSAAAVQAGRRARSSAAAPSSRAVRPTASRAWAKTGLRMLRDAAEAHDLALDLRGDGRQPDRADRQLRDIFQVGARNMQNFTLLRELGRTRKPVLLKRGISATIEEWLLSAEYLLAGGNNDVILCERGIRTFETRHAQHLRYLGDSGGEEAEPPADRRRPEPRRRPARHGGADGARGRGRWRGRPDHRGAPRSRPRAQRRRAVDVSRRSSTA